MINLIYARSINGVIGNNNTLPWHLKEDLQRFRRLTEYRTIIMGSRTYSSIGNPLKSRQSIVITRNKSLSIPDNEGFGNCVVHSKEGAIEKIRDKNGVAWVIGGEQIYRMFEEECDRIYETIVLKHFDGDTSYIPNYKIRKLLTTELKCDIKNRLDFQFNVWVRN